MTKLFFHIKVSDEVSTSTWQKQITFLPVASTSTWIGSKLSEIACSILIRFYVERERSGRWWKEDVTIARSQQRRMSTTKRERYQTWSRSLCWRMGETMIFQKIEGTIYKKKIEDWNLDFRVGGGGKASF